MAIDKVSSSNLALSKQGNLYNKTNVGLYTGITAGTLGASYGIYSGLKFLKSNGAVDFSQSIKALAKDIISAIRIKSGKAGLAVMAVLTLGAGLGIGKLVDNFINNKRANKIDIKNALDKKNNATISQNE